MFPRLAHVFRCSSAVAFGCEGNSTDPAHIPRQMLRALPVDESLREQLETKSDIQPLSLCSELVAPTKSRDALQTNASRLLLTDDGVRAGGLSGAPTIHQILNEESAHR